MHTISITKSLLILFILCCYYSVFAHESRPVHVRIVQSEQAYDISVNVPSSVAFSNLPAIGIANLLSNDNIIWMTTDVGFKQNWSFQSTEELRGHTVSIVYPLFNPVLSTIITMQFVGGEQQVLVLPPNKSLVVIPDEADEWQVLQRYTMLGIEHIWAGIDHLLFVVCLLFVTAQTRKIWITITGFTIAHSITLALSALHVISLQIPPIEATIALSIVFLCYEIIHYHDDRMSLAYRYPILVSSSFGLLHGLGFAAVLSDIGLPNNHQLFALLFFNLGVEIGQILFIVSIFLLVSIIRLLFSKMDIKVKEKVLGYGLRAIVYFVGSVASFWMFDRLF